MESPRPGEGGAAAQSATSSAHASPAPLHNGHAASGRRSAADLFAEAVQDAFPEEKHPAAFHGALAQLSGPGGWTAVNDIVKATNLARLECNAGDAQGASDQTAFRTVVWDDKEVSQLAEALIQTLVVAQVCWPQRMHACVSRGGRRGDF